MKIVNGLKTTLTATGLLLGFSLSCTTVLANTVAVWDSQAAVINTNYAKSQLASLQNNIKPRQQQLNNIRLEINALQEKFQKNSGSMSLTEKQQLQAQVQSKLGQYNRIAESLQQQIEDTQNKIIQTLKPKITNVKNTIIKQKKIDVLIDKRQQAVSYVAPEWDITQQVIAEVNK